MSERTSNTKNSQRRGVVLFCAVIILILAWGVLIFGFPMDSEAALLLVTPFAMCIIVVEGSIWFAQYVANRHEK